MKHYIFLLPLLISGLCLNSCQISKKSTGSTHPPLKGTHWNVTTIYERPLSQDIDIQPFIIFDTNGRCHGNLGCNIFFGEYSVKKNKIELSYIGSTKKLCQSMDTERAFAKALKNDIDSYVFKQDVLILYSGKREILQLKKGGQ